MLRLLKRVIYVLLRELRGLFLLQCNYDINQINIPSTFYYELLQWWSDLRETADSDSGYKKTRKFWLRVGVFFHRHYYDNNIIYTKDLLFERTNIESFTTVKGKALVSKDKFFSVDRLEKSFAVGPTIYKNNFRSGYWFRKLKMLLLLMLYNKNKYEKPRKWAKLTEVFELREKSTLRSIPPTV